MKYSLDKYQVYKVSHEHVTLWWSEPDVYVRIAIPGVQSLNAIQVAGQIRQAIRDMLVKPQALPDGRTLCLEDFGLTSSSV